jgi:hypothetical protein
MTESDLRSWIFKNVRVCTSLTNSFDDYPDIAAITGATSVLEVYNADGKRWERLRASDGKIVTWEYKKGWVVVDE